MTQTTDKPLVSVIMITYNQEKYIEKAVRSVLSQRTAFDFEIIIADDASGDRTVEICSRLSKEYPGKINLIARTKNLGTSGNYMDAWGRCRGKYIAICEGDDWWLTTNKLSVQAEYMESHPECTVCFHRVANYYPEKHNWSLCGKPSTIDFGLTELAKGNIITNLSVMYRALPVSAIPDWVKRTPLFDYAMHSLHAAGGRIHFIPSVMGVYRKHSYGIWSGDALRARRLATEIRLLLLEHFHESHPEAAKIFLEKYYENAIALAAALQRDGNEPELKRLTDEIKATCSKYG
ncbi:MAG: glycosyltransferase, partial [Paramuribaculum sp.]|nr:glycosyltransferase [Paramuribaculum sp.]